jgi:hypothetical protein
MCSLHPDATKAEAPERGPGARRADRATGEAGG